MEWYLKVLRNYVGFEGRARRKEFWMFALINFIIGLILSAIEAVFGSFGILSTLYGLAILLPSLAVTVRRLHDTNKTGWWVLIGLVPVIGFIVLLIMTIQDSTPGANQYGPNPKEAGGVATESV